MKLVLIILLTILLPHQYTFSQNNKRKFKTEYHWLKKYKIGSVKYKSKNEIIYGFIYNYSDSIFPNEEILKHKNLISLELFYLKYPDFLNCKNSNPRFIIDSVKLKELKHLKRLTFDSHPFDSIPKALYLMDSLQYLKITRSELKEIPDDIWKFKNIVELDFMENCINYISCNISMLQNLRILKLNNNRLIYVSEYLKDITNLEFIDFSSIYFGRKADANENLIDIKSLENIIALINKESLKFIGLRILNSEEQKRFIRSINDKDLIKKIGFDFKHYDLGNW